MAFAGSSRLPFQILSPPPKVPIQIFPCRSATTVLISFLLGIFLPSFCPLTHPRRKREREPLFCCYQFLLHPFAYTNERLYYVFVYAKKERIFQRSERENESLSLSPHLFSVLLLQRVVLKALRIWIFRVNRSVSVFYPPADNRKEWRISTTNQGDIFFSLL